MLLPYQKNQIGNRDSLADSFVMMAVKLESLSERYLFKPAGLSSASFKILIFVRRHPDCSPSQIMDYLGGTKSNITQRLNFLERLGFISSYKPKEGDKRKVLVCLSESGSKKLKEVLDSFRKNSVYLEKFFTQQELKNHYLFMNKLNSALGDCEQVIKDKQYKLVKHLKYEKK